MIVTFYGALSGKNFSKKLTDKPFFFVSPPESCASRLQLQLVSRRIICTFCTAGVSRKAHSSKMSVSYTQPCWRHHFKSRSFLLAHHGGEGTRPSYSNVMHCRFMIHADETIEFSLFWFEIKMRYRRCQAPQPSIDWHPGDHIHATFAVFDKPKRTLHCHFMIHID